MQEEDQVAAVVNLWNKAEEVQMVVVVNWLNMVELLEEYEA